MRGGHHRDVWVTIHARQVRLRKAPSYCEVEITGDPCLRGFAGNKNATAKGGEVEFGATVRDRT